MEKRLTTYTDYTFKVGGRVTVSMMGSDSTELYDAALEKAVAQVAEEIDISWIGDCAKAQTYTEYEGV